MSYFSGRSPLDASTFIHYYVNIRHLHHYLMSEAVGWQSAKWIILFLIPFYYSFKIKDTKYAVLSGLIFASFIIAPLTQFLGTKVFKIKKIAELGPSRFTAYASILWGLNSIIVGSVVFQKQNMIKDKFVKYIKSIFSYPFIQNIILASQIILSVIELFLIYKTLITLNQLIICV